MTKMTEKEKNKAKTKWEKMLSDPDHAHNIVCRGREGAICEYLAGKILENESEFFGEMGKGEYKLSRKIESDSNGGYHRYGYYKRERGDSKERKNNSNRGEDLNSITLYGKYPDVVIDRQTPLRDHSPAKPDLLLYDKGALIFGEVKKDDSKETLLRAIIEIERYYAFVNHEVLINDFKEACPRMKEKDVKYNKVQKAILVSSYTFKENDKGKKTFSLKDQLTKEEYPNVQTLIKRRNIFIIDADKLNKEGKIQYFQGFSPQDYCFIN